MRRKAAIELSMNFLVIMILSIVTLSIGIYLAVRSLEDATYAMHSLDEQLSGQIEELVAGDSVVAPFPSAVETTRSNIEEFWVGVRNTGYGSNFRLGVDQDTQTGSCDSALRILFPHANTPPTLIKENEKGRLGIAIKVPAAAKPCQYVFDVLVYKCPENEPYCQNPSLAYDAMQKLYLDVT